MRSWGILCVVVTVLLGIVALPYRTAHADESCRDLLILGSRGSSENVARNQGVGPAVESFSQTFETAVAAAGKTVAFWANGYPALPVAGGWEGLVNALDAGQAVGNGRLSRYRASVAKGEANLKAKIESTISACPATQLVLSGYSQGAQVTGTVYRSLSAAQRERVLGVALFGDPLLNGRALTSLGNLDRNRNGLLTNWFDGSAPEEFPLPRDKVRSYCHALDPVCQGVLRWSPLTKAFDLGQHANYGPGQDAYPVDAAKFFAARVRPAPPSSGPGATITPFDGAIPASVHVGAPGVHTGIPGPPTSVTWAAAADRESATVTWQPPAAGQPPAEGYEVVTPDGRLVAVIDHGGPASLTVQDRELPLTIVVKALNRLGASVGPAPVRVSLPSEVMVVGDSITQGSAGDFTWRYRFDKHEAAAGAQLSLVGPRDDLFDNVANTLNNNHTYADPAFNQRHGSLWGESLGGGAAHIGGDVATYKPDYLLVLLGINDLAFGMSDPAGTEASLRTFIANARTADPEVQFVFGTLLPSQRTQSEAGFASMVADFNARLRSTTDELSTADSQIYVGETAGDIVPQSDLWDGSHPNAQGEVKIAAAFADSLAGNLSIGAPYPRPYPTVPLGPQVAPQLTATPGNGQAALSWTLSPGATGYYVHTKDVTAGETTFTRLPFPVTGPTWTAGLLTNGHTYQFQLKAVKGTAEGVFSTIATVTPTVPAPDAVTDLSVSPGAGIATLSWTPVANATGYYVFRKNVTAGETAFTQLPWPVSGPTWVADGLTPGETYQFRLQAANGDVRGGMSNVGSATVTGVTPNAVTNLSATPGAGIATLSWTPVANATGYYVFRKNVTAGETGFTQLPWPVSGPSWVADSLTPGGTYQFQLQAANGQLRSGMSNVATVVVTGPTPATVTNLTAVPSGNGEATLSWTRVANATGYYVHVKNVSAGETTFTKLPWPVAGPTWLSTGLVPGGRYQYRVQSVNGYLLGGLSNVVDVTAGGVTPAGPTDLRATAGSKQATLSWTPVASTTGYYVYVRNVSAGEAGFTQLQVPVAGPSWVASLLKAGSRYEFKLQSVNGYIRGGFSNVASVTAGA